MIMLNCFYKSVLLISILIMGLFQSNYIFAFETMKSTDDYDAKWFRNSLPVPYYINSAGSADISGNADIQALVNSFNTWENVSCSYFTASYAGTTSESQTGSSQMNLMVWHEYNWPSEYGDTAIGVTTPWIQPGSGEILHADIAYNGVNYTWTTQPSGSPSGYSNVMDVANIATHEIGHFLGLDHPGDIAGATMYYSTVGNATSSRTLHQDDINGICYLYPNDPGVLGSPCSYSNDCDSRMCISDTSGYFCSKTCTPQGSECPVGFHCASYSSSSTGYACMLGSFKAEEGESCIDASCETGLMCVGDGQGYAICLRECRPSRNGSDCRTGETCLEMGDDDQGVCLGESDEGGPCGESARCKEPLICMASSATGGTCYRECDPDINNSCGRGFVCEDVFSTEIKGLCYPAVGLDQSCESSRCENNLVCIPDADGNGNNLCRKRCTPTDSNPDCPDGLFCVRLQGLEGYCTEGTQREGEGCSTAYCEEGLLCLAIGSGDPICRRMCNPSNSSCPEGQYCREMSSSDLGGACIPDTNSNVDLADLGEVCSANKPCEEGLICVYNNNASTAGTCRDTCLDNSSCPNGFTCQSAGGTKVCLPAPDDPNNITNNSNNINNSNNNNITNNSSNNSGTNSGTNSEGSECNEDSDCSSGNCRTGNSTKKCVTGCSSKSTCSNGYECLNLGGEGYCWPSSGLSDLYGRFADPCTSRGKCLSGICVPDGNYCSDKCNYNSDCPYGFNCTELSDNLKVCTKFVSQDYFSSECNSRADCTTSTCVQDSFGGDAFCSDTCNQNNVLTCPSGFTCGNQEFCESQISSNQNSNILNPGGGSSDGGNGSCNCSVLSEKTTIDMKFPLFLILFVLLFTTIIIRKKE